MTDNKYVLAMYDVRGKQDYIFRSTKIREIVGGSLVIRDIFKDELFPAAKEVANEKGFRNGIKEYCLETGLPSFDRNLFMKDMAGNEYLGEVVYEGGGNFFILYKDMETFKLVNKIFTKRVMEHTYSLTVLCSGIGGVDFDNFTNRNQQVAGEEKGDREKLYEENRKREARINPQIPAQVLPFTQVDYANSMPLYKRNEFARGEQKEEKITKEAFRKYEKYRETEEKAGDEFSEVFLDSLAKEKGEDSWIAVMYIDGNNMGAQVQELFDGETKVTYEKAVAKLRKFSSEIQKQYIDERLKDIDACLKEKYEQEGKDYKRRLVVYAGDEINIILNAHDAYNAAKAYFTGLSKVEKASACAGIAIFKSHTPYSDAYRIAEECCENGKQYMKRHGIREANFLDFHYCQGAIGTDLETIREKEAGDICSKPWFVSGEDTGDIDREKLITIEMIEALAKNLNTCSRTNIKGLLDCAKNSEADLWTELKRMEVRRDKDKVGKVEDITQINSTKEKTKSLKGKKLRKMIYDIVSVYDLWFKDMKWEEENNA